MALTPCCCSRAAYRLAVDASSRNDTPAIPPGATSRLVPRSVSPMNPIVTPSTVRVVVGGRIGMPVAVATTFAARYWKAAPAKDRPP